MSYDRYGRRGYAREREPANTPCARLRVSPLKKRLAGLFIYADLLADAFRPRVMPHTESQFKEGAVLTSTYEPCAVSLARRATRKRPRP